MTVIAAAAVGATLWLCVLIARAHLLGYIYVLLCYVIVPWTVLRCLTARSLDADSVSWCVLVLWCVCVEGTLLYLCERAVTCVLYSTHVRNPT